MTNIFGIPHDKLLVFYETGILPHFQFENKIAQWLNLEIELDLMDSDLHFFVSDAGYTYALWSEDVWGGFEEVEIAISAQKFQLIGYIAVREPSPVVKVAREKMESSTHGTDQHVYSRKSQKLDSRDPIWARDYVLAYVKKQDSI